MSLLTLTINKSPDGVFTISPAGSIDSETYPIFEKSIDEVFGHTPKTLVLDMNGVKYVSSMGITALLSAKNRIEKIGGTFVMTNLQPQIRKVFDIVRAIPNQNIFVSREELDRYLAKIQQKESEKKGLA